MLLYKLFIGAGPIVQFWIPTFRILAKSLNTMQHWKAVFGSSTAEQVKDLCWATRHSSHTEKVWAIYEIIETSHILLKRVCRQWDKIFIAGERSYGSRVGSFFPCICMASKTLDNDTQHKPLVKNVPFFASHEILAPLRIKGMRVCLHGCYQLSYVFQQEDKWRGQWNRLPLQAWRAIHKIWAKWSVCDTEEVFEIDIILVQAELPDMVPWDKLLEETSWDPVLTEMKNAEENVLPL